MSASGRYIEIPLNQLLDRRKVTINAKYFRVAQIGSQVTICPDPADTVGEPVTSAGKTFECCEDSFGDIFISNEQIGEGVLILYVSDNIRISDGPSDASSEQGTTLLAHFAVQGPPYNMRLRNLLMSELSADGDISNPVSGGAFSGIADNDLVGGDSFNALRLIKDAAAAAGGARAYYTNMQAPLDRLLNSRGGVFPLAYDYAPTDYFEVEDEIAGSLADNGGGGRAYVAFGMGNLLEDLGAMAGWLVGFYSDLTSGNLWEAVIFSAGAAGASATFHHRVPLTGFDIRNVYSGKLRAGRRNSSRFVEWLINGRSIHTFSPPVGVNIAARWGGQAQSALFYNATATANASRADLWGMLGTGAKIRAVKSI